MCRAKSHPQDTGQQTTLNACVSGLQFKRSFKRNDKPICSAVCQFLAHLINQQVADDMLAFEIAILLLDNPSGGPLSTLQLQPHLSLMLAIVFPFKHPGHPWLVDLYCFSGGWSVAF